MKRITNTLIFLCSLAAICFMVKDINVGNYDRILGDITIPLVLLIPRIIKNLFKIRITDTMELIYVVFNNDTTWWYDLFAHFLSGVLTSVLALVVLNWFGVYKEKNKGFNFLFIICFTLMVASIWEFVEFGTDVFLGMNVQHSLETGVKDTMEDMLVAFAGSMIVGITYLLEGKNGFVKKIVSDLV